jgi:hypothetical protein
MSLWEFGFLPASVRHAVWRAHAEGRVDAVPAGQVLRYRRSQVLALLYGTAAARC